MSKAELLPLDENCEKELKVVFEVNAGNFEKNRVAVYAVTSDGERKLASIGLATPSTIGVDVYTHSDQFSERTAINI